MNRSGDFSPKYRMQGRNIMDKYRCERLLWSMLAVFFAASFTSCGTLLALSEVNTVKTSDEWGEPRLLPPIINTTEWEDSPSISPDRTTLYFTRGRDRDVDIYVSNTTPEGWSEPEMLSELQEKTFPTGGPHSHNSMTLFFSSYRPGGIGEADIYYSMKGENGWGKPTNLGKTVNSEKMDAEPYISFDAKTLYFSSNRNGSTDIWMSQKEVDDSWGTPQNIGPPVNTSGDETQPFLTHDGQELYFMAVNRDEVPGPAIFRSKKLGDGWGEPELVISGMVGEPTLTSDKKYLYFVHIILEGTGLKDAEIMFVERVKQ